METVNYIKAFELNKTHKVRIKNDDGTQGTWFEQDQLRERRPADFYVKAKYEVEPVKFELNVQFRKTDSYFDMAHLWGEDDEKTKKVLKALNGQRVKMTLEVLP